MNILTRKLVLQMIHVKTNLNETMIIMAGFTSKNSPLEQKEIKFSSIHIWQDLHEEADDFNDDEMVIKTDMYVDGFNMHIHIWLISQLVHNLITYRYNELLVISHN